MQEDIPNAGGLLTAINAITNRIDHLTARIDASIAFDRDIAVTIEQMHTAMLTKDQYIKDKVGMDERLVRVEEYIAEQKELPAQRNGSLRVVVMAIAVVATVSLASLGLNLTTLIFLLNHMGAR